MNIVLQMVKISGSSSAGRSNVLVGYSIGHGFTRGGGRVGFYPTRLWLEHKPSLSLELGMGVIPKLLDMSKFKIKLFGMLH